MADNSDNDKQNDIQLKSDIKLTNKDNEELNSNEDTKDIEEDSQEIKSSDLV